MIGSVVYLTGAFGGTVLGGAAGAAWGSAAGTLIGAGVWWWELHQGVRDAESGKLDAEPAERDTEPAGLG